VKRTAAIAALCLLVGCASEDDATQDETSGDGMIEQAVEAQRRPGQKAEALEQQLQDAQDRVARATAGEAALQSARRVATPVTVDSPGVLTGDVALVRERDRPACPTPGVSTQRGPAPTQGRFRRDPGGPDVEPDLGRALEDEPCRCGTDTDTAAGSPTARSRP